MSPPLEHFIGDDATLEVNLTHKGAPFSPGVEWALTFTLKNHITDADASAVCQKTTDNGITAAGSVASVELIHADTLVAKAGSAVFDIKAQHIGTGKVRTVACDPITIRQPVNNSLQTSVPINTTAEPAPFAASVNSTNVLAALTGLDAGEVTALRAALAAAGIILAPLPA